MLWVFRIKHTQKHPFLSKRSTTVKPGTSGLLGNVEQRAPICDNRSVEVCVNPNQPLGVWGTSTSSYCNINDAVSPSLAGETICYDNDSIARMPGCQDACEKQMLLSAQGFN